MRYYYHIIYKSVNPLWENFSLNWYIAHFMRKPGRPERTGGETANYYRVESFFAPSSTLLPHFIQGFLCPVNPLG